MSITLSDLYSETRIEDIDAELDRFNDALGDHGYSAAVSFTKWGEPLIEVTIPSGATTEFIDDLDAFQSYRIAAEQLIIETEGAAA